MNEKFSIFIVYNVCSTVKSLAINSNAPSFVERRELPIPIRYASSRDISTHNTMT